MHQYITKMCGLVETMSESNRCVSPLNPITLLEVGVLATAAAQGSTNPMTKCSELGWYVSLSWLKHIGLGEMPLISQGRGSVCHTGHV